MTIARTTEILRDLIAYPTVSSDPNLAMIEDLAARLTALGARVEVLAAPETGKANLFATLGPRAPGGIVLSGHTDVVPVADQHWTTDPFELTEREGLLFGRGTCDMKGFIAATLAMAETLKGRTLSRPLHFAFTHDEETGCLGAQNLVEDLRRRDVTPDIAIVGEPTEMRIIEGHKGCHEYTTRFTGLAGHGSAPETGVNAAEYAVCYVSKLLELRDALKERTPEGSDFDPPWSTINVGRISGGIAHNVIVEKAEVAWDMRPVVQEDADFVTTTLANYVRHDLLPAMQAVHPSAAIDVETIAEVAGLVPMDRNAARDLVSELTGANSTDLVAFGTEGGLFQSLGTDVVVCGPGSIAQAHKPDEYVSKDQLASCCRMLDKLAARLIN